MQPRIRTTALTSLVVLFLVGFGAAGLAVLPMLGYSWCIATVTGLALAWLVFGRRPTAAPLKNAAPGQPIRFWRKLALPRIAAAGVLALWLGLVFWAELSPGGPPLTAKADPAAVRVLTWNIHCGQDTGPPWQQFDWPARKHALRQAIDDARPDLLCVQEARQEQVVFLEQVLPTHQRLGVGRDDGQSGGEHCAIYFNRDRFTELRSGTFWLEEPTDAPPDDARPVKRICTWARLLDRQTGRTVMVFNTHQYLTEKARWSAAQLLRDQIVAADLADNIILTGDFNAGPLAPSRRLFTDALLADSAFLAGQSARTKTLHHAGIPLWPLDGILVGSGWRVNSHQFVKGKYRHKYPSDHFGVMADLAYGDR